MKKIYLLLFAAILSFVSCDKDNNNDITDKILANVTGTWIIDQMDDADMPNNEIFVMEFDGAGVQGYGFRAVDGDNGSWCYTTCDYRVSGDRIYFESETLDLEIQIVDIDDDDIKYRVIIYFEGDVDQQETNIYEGYKVDDDYTSQIVGAWKGSDKQYISSTENQHIWEFKADNTFIYQSYDATSGNWVTKTDNDGTYFIYGDLLVMEYSNSELTSVDGRSCDIWEIEIETESTTTTMEWKSSSVDGSQSRFYMEKQ